MPDVFLAEVDIGVGMVSGVPSTGFTTVIVELVAFGYVQRVDAVGNRPWQVLLHRLQRDDDILERTHRTVSFQPSSSASGGLMAPSQPTRLITWTLNRWKWMA